MSASVIRRGLDLFSDDCKDGEKRKERKMSCQKATVMKQTGPQHQRSRTTVKHKHIRSAVDEYKKKQKKSRLKANLEYFLSADYKTQSDHSTKIIQQNSGRRACHQPDQPVSKPKEKSVFTEEDFQKFQEDYFSNL